MPLSASDIKVYGAASRAEANGVTQGGIIDATCRYVFDDTTFANTLNDKLNMRSTDATDNATIWAYGRDAGGVIVSGVHTLVGNAISSGTVTFERIMKIVSTAGSKNGTVTVSGQTTGTLLVLIESGVTELRRAFWNVSADAAGGSSRDFYEKIFVKNNHATLALLSGTIKESGDSTTYVTFALESGMNTNTSVATRLNVGPDNCTAFDNNDKALPYTNLLAGSGAPVWMKLSLAAGTPANKGTWTLNITGSST